MKVMSTIEKISYQQGWQEGIEKGEAGILLKQLKTKFQNVPEEYITKVNNANGVTLNQYITNFVFANSLEEVFKIQ